MKKNLVLRQAMSNRAQVHFRGDVQLSDDELLPLERFAVGKAVTFIFLKEYTFKVGSNTLFKYSSKDLVFYAILNLDLWVQSGRM